MAVCPVLAIAHTVTAAGTTTTRAPLARKLYGTRQIPSRFALTVT